MAAPGSWPPVGHLSVFGSAQFVITVLLHNVEANNELVYCTVTLTGTVTNSSLIP